MLQGYNCVPGLFAAAEAEASTLCRTNTNSTHTVRPYVDLVAASSGPAHAGLLIAAIMTCLLSKLFLRAPPRVREHRGALRTFSSRHTFQGQTQEHPAIIRDYDDPFEGNRRGSNAKGTRQLDVRRTERNTKPYNPPPCNTVDIRIGRSYQAMSAVFLRDICKCSACIDQSTLQKLFSTADIPSSIQAREVSSGPGGKGVCIRWQDDVPGFDAQHLTVIGEDMLRRVIETGNARPRAHLPKRKLWNAQTLGDQVEDVEYDAYMQDDNVLLKALRTLHSHGLLFLSNVPGEEASVSRIAERIGPLKHTFYGQTWDVRSVPEAKNVAYTAQDLGFHMDLLYMQQPPHLQFLHCIRSSSAGGASLFTDSYRAASDLFDADPDAFNRLSTIPTSFHYDHREHQYYHSRPTIELGMLKLGGQKFNNLVELKDYLDRSEYGQFKVSKSIEAVAWSPPFQAPFSLPNHDRIGAGRFKVSAVNNMMTYWHEAARQFSQLVHRPEGIYERLMKPGECVIFDNRRVLHARKAFEVADAGSERWLRGAYLDKDPYLSKLKVLECMSVSDVPRTDTTAA